MSKYYGDKELFATPEVSQYGSHMVMTNVVKPTRVKYLNLDTRFADDYVNNTTNLSNLTTYNQSSYTFTLPERITNVKSITARTVEFPNAYYTMSEYEGNNIMSIKIGNNTQVIAKITEGHITDSAMQTAVYSAITSAGITDLSCVFDVSAGKYKLTNTSGINDITINFAINPDGTCDKYHFKKKLGWLLGFRKTSYTIPRSNGTITSESVLQHRPLYYYLAIDEFSNGNQNSFSSQIATSVINKNILSKIVMGVTGYGFRVIIPLNNFNGLLMSDTRRYNGKIDIQKINMQLLNEYGDTANLNGADYSVTLEIEYE